MPLVYTDEATITIVAIMINAKSSTSLFIMLLNQPKTIIRLGHR